MQQSAPNLCRPRLAVYRQKNLSSFSPAERYIEAEHMIFHNSELHRYEFLHQWCDVSALASTSGRQWCILNRLIN